MPIYCDKQQPIILHTQRLIVRTVKANDAYLLADYYSNNQRFLTPWEPVRGQSYRSVAGWQVRIKLLHELQAAEEFFSFLLLDQQQSEVIGVASFSHISRGNAYSCFLGYSLAENKQGQGLMYESLQVAISYMCQHQHMHRINAGYMPHNLRSGRLLARLGFEQEGYAKNYLLINNQWQDHILTAFINSRWSPPL